MLSLASRFLLTFLFDEKQTRDKARPAQFVIGSRSNSRDRFDLEAARSRAGDRTGTFATRHSVVTEEADTDEEEEGQEQENESLLHNDGDGSFITPLRKPFRVSSVYGTIATTGSPHYLTLEGVDKPGGLRRNESIFKVSLLAPFNRETGQRRQGSSFFGRWKQWMARDSRRKLVRNQIFQIAKKSKQSIQRGR